MIRNFFSALYGSAPAEFESGYGVDESVRRLSEASRRSFLQRGSEARLFGSVTERRVVLHWAVPLWMNFFKPVFHGRFVQRDGRVVLSGAFGISKAVRVAYSAILALFALLSATSVFTALTTHQKLGFPSTLIALLIAFVILPVFLRDSADAHVEEISRTVRKTLRRA